MKYQILVSNKSGIATGEIIGVFGPSHIFSPAETMAEHIKAGGTVENWSRLFSLVISTDGNYNDMKHLEEYKADGLTKKYYFKVPAQNTTEFSELYQTGQTTRTTSEILEFIGEH